MDLLIADDNARFRQRLASVLKTINGIGVIGEAEDVGEAIEAIGQFGPRVVILDLHMPGGSGFDVLRSAKNMNPSPLVIVLTVASPDEYREKCTAAGADYFFQKTRDLGKVIAVLSRLNEKSAATLRASEQSRLRH